MDDFKLAVLKNNFETGVLNLLEEYLKERGFNEFSNQIMMTEANIRTDISNLYNEIYSLKWELEEVKKENEDLKYKLNNLRITF